MPNLYDIEVKNISKIYKKTTAVEDISLQVKKGEVFGFLGPNGAGKTTTIRIMTGLLPASSGCCKVLGEEISGVDSDFYRKIGIVFENNNLYMRLSGEKNLRFFASMYQLDNDIVYHLLEKFALLDAAKRPVKSYSKGMKQRLLICRALLHDPKLLILDEPTSGLDPMSVEIIHQAIEEFRDTGKTVFLSTHYMEEADSLCDRLAFINKGSLIAVERPVVLKERYGESYIEIKVLLDKGQESAEMFEEIINQDDILELDDNIMTIKLSLINNDVGLRLDKIRSKSKVLSIHSREATLHDVFMRLTTLS
ncbi:ABC transporter ATP-binding protein [Halocella sp. SP3-1]|uniref:ABC transporter ATP-binding protein n=1 Tax=Halocella sp. SP3-1 TaxID=2382161 RepID=UPI000F75BF3A|nr:ABC transporter ATP-binding protein [Halocella sp. SP3-1]AZO95841.1 ABC transporter ATP-binding protein [Halocella sp. SP3-1]